MDPTNTAPEPKLQWYGAMGATADAGTVEENTSAREGALRGRLATAAEDAEAAARPTSVGGCASEDIAAEAQGSAAAVEVSTTAKASAAVVTDAGRPARKSPTPRGYS